jgi:predicted DNA-binding transcriptional regulator AlpA
MSRKTENTRPYPPDYASIETLAYRLDCSPSTVRQYVDLKWLPKPLEIGNLVRWRWSEVDTYIATRFGSGLEAVGDHHDEFSDAVRRHAQAS